MSWSLTFQILLLVVVFLIVLSLCVDMFLDKVKELEVQKRLTEQERQRTIECEFAVIKAKNPDVKDWVTFPRRAF